MPFTNIDFIRLAGEEAAAELATNADLAEHAAKWTELWGRYPDGEDQLSGHLYLCRRLVGHRPRTRFLSLQTAWEQPTDASGDPKIIDVWPAFADHYASTGERTMFSLVPLPTAEA